MALSDQACRRQSQVIELRAKRALLGPSMHLKAQDPTAKNNFYGDLLNDLIFLRSLEARRHIAIARWCGGKPLRLALALLNRRGVVGCLCGEVAASQQARRCRGPIRNRLTTHTTAARATQRRRHYLPCANEMKDHAKEGIVIGSATRVNAAARIAS